MTVTVYEERTHPAGPVTPPLRLVPPGNRTLLRPSRINKTPEPLTQAELLALVGSYDAIPEGPATLGQRAYELLELTDRYEVWVIHWPVDGQLELHDHGGSSGAFWVSRGSLIESAPGRNGALTRRRVLANSGVAFSPEYVHDVVNEGPAVATTVHAYSPPMPGMTFYDLSDGGLRPTRAEYRDEPSWAP